MAEQSAPSLHKVVFLEDVVLYDGDGAPREAFAKGDVVDLPYDRAHRWLRRNKARRFEDVPQEELARPKQATLESVLLAIGKVDADNPALWMKSGAPTIDAIETYTDGAKVPAQLRDLAWVKYRQQHQPDKSPEKPPVQQPAQPHK